MSSPTLTSSQVSIRTPLPGPFPDRIRSQTGGHTWVQNRVGAEWDIPQDWTTRLLSSVFSYLAQAEHTNAKRVRWRSTTSSPTKLRGGCYSNKAKRKMAITGAANSEVEVKKKKGGHGQQVSVQNRLQLLHQGGHGRGCPNPSQNMALGEGGTSVSYIR